MTQHENSTGQRWLSIVEYARAFHISDMTIRRRIKTGKLSATLKDGKYYIPVSEDVFQSSQISQTSLQHNKSAVPAVRGGASHYLKHHQHNIPKQSQPASVSIGVQSHAGLYNGQTQDPVLPQSVESLASQSHVSTASSAVVTPSGPSGNQKQVAVDVDQLFSTCQSFMQKISQQNKDLQTSYENKILYLEKSLMLKDQAIAQLQQKIEDLQLLVQIFEGKQPCSSSVSSLVTSSDKMCS